jgi:hypothetical protein
MENAVSQDQAVPDPGIWVSVTEPANARRRHAPQRRTSDQAIT